MITTLANDESAEKKSIFNILDEVQHITDETSLLALNAVLEAGRLGESGRDFADEVRQLLLTSNKLNNEIKSCVTSS